MNRLVIFFFTEKNYSAYNFFVFSNAGQTVLQTRFDAFEKELELEASAREKKVWEKFEKQKSCFLEMFERQCQTKEDKIKAEACHKLVSKSSEPFLWDIVNNSSTKS